jgi:hypothetical protein
VKSLVYIFHALAGKELSVHIDHVCVISFTNNQQYSSEQNNKIFKNYQLFTIIPTPSLLVFRYPYHSADQM